VVRFKNSRKLSEYDDEDNVFAFFNTEKWSGNLRITHFRWEDVMDAVDKAFLYKQSELKDNPNSIIVKLGDWDATFRGEQTDNTGIAYFWTTGSKNDLFLCSFSFDKEFHNTDWHNNELITVGEILGSIKILN
jgi:hypothetical protein